MIAGLLCFAERWVLVEVGLVAETPNQLHASAIRRSTCAAACQTQQRCALACLRHSDSPRLAERRAARRIASYAAGIQERIFGFFLGATRKKLARRGEIPASEVKAAVVSETNNLSDQKGLSGNL